MADVERENVLGFVDRRRLATDANVRATTPANYLDVGGLRARLAALQPATFTAKKLNEMTKNDMVFALRHLDDAASIR